jgi:glucose-6-phosphate 1-epimerase
VVTFYEYTQQPRYWVVHDDDGYWLVPARTDGWNERSPFVGHVLALRQLTDLEGIDLGMPADGAAPAGRS